MYHKIIGCGRTFCEKCKCQFGSKECEKHAGNPIYQVIPDGKYNTD